jgi:AcrR family transcriptional regulator
MRARFDDDRRKELLDGVVGIITRRGFADVTISELARELHCSASSLYRIASSKDSLVVLAISHWGESALENMESRARKGKSSSERARLYLRAAVDVIRPLSHEFRSDVNRFESSRMAYASVSDRFLKRLSELINEAVKAGEVRRINTKFHAQMYRQMALLIRDEELLRKSGLSASQAIAEVESLIWEGIRSKQNGTKADVIKNKGKKKAV